jgi:hypothetical protein
VPDVGLVVIILLLAMPWLGRRTNLSAAQHRMQQSAELWYAPLRSLCFVRPQLMLNVLLTEIECLNGAVSSSE